MCHPSAYAGGGSSRSRPPPNQKVRRCKEDLEVQNEVATRATPEAKGYTSQFTTSSSCTKDYDVEREDFHINWLLHEPVRLFFFLFRLFFFLFRLFLFLFRLFFFLFLLFFLFRLS